MTVKPQIGSVVATAGQQINLSSLFSVTSGAGNPAYLIVSGLDRDEYTAGYNTANMGALSGDGVSQKFSFNGGDAYSVGVVFTYQAATGQYINATYGNLNQVTFTASSNTNDNVSLSVYGTNSASFAADYAADPYVLEENPSASTYLGSVSVVTQPAAAAAPAQATPDSICAAAQSFVGDAWNMDGCWVLASNISAEAGASLPASSTLAGVAGEASGEWIVAYNGPTSAAANWEQNVTAGEIVGFITTAGGGHITTVVSGAGASAMLIDNITYVNGNGSIENAANDGSANDIIVASAHAATQEFSGVNPSDVVVYELDTPTVSDAVASVSLLQRASAALSPLFRVSNPVAGQSITEWQVYDTNTGDSITVGGIAKSAHSAATAATVTSLTGVALQAGGSSGTDTIEVRAYNGSYWGDWQGLAATVGAPSAPTLTSQTASQIWTQGERVNLVLPANSFTDPQGEVLTYTASQSNGAALPSWLSFNAASRTFTGTVPKGLEALTLKVTATDSSGLSASETFGVNVPAAAPTLTSQTAGQTWLQGQKISLTLPANSFTDPQSQTLSYTASQSNGAALPSWLSFNAATRTFSGTVPGGLESLSLKVTATDSSGLSASETFAVTVPAAAPAVSDQTANLTLAQGQAISLALPANTFTDPQGEKLTLKAAQSSGAALPSWLSFNAATNSFSGTAPKAAASLTLKVTATDTNGLSASETFGVTVAGTSGAAATHGDVVGITASSAAFNPAPGFDAMQFISSPAGNAAPGGSAFSGDFGFGTLFGQAASAASILDSAKHQVGGFSAALDDMRNNFASLPGLIHHGATFG